MELFKSMIEEILEDGYNVPAARANMPGTIVAPNVSRKFNFMRGFPILTAKAMPFYSIASELIGFMKGITDVRYFDVLGCGVWWDNAYKWNIVDKEIIDPSTDNIVSKERYKEGNLEDSLYDLGRIYSAQWRSWNGEIDQLEELISSIKNNPASRYHVMTTWNPSEMNAVKVSQPNCHVYFQATCVPIAEYEKPRLKRYLSNFLTDDTVDDLLESGYNPNHSLFTNLTQRSADMFLGVPFNITSYSLFTILLGIFTNTLPIEFTWMGVNSHIYANHENQANEYINNDIHELPKLRIKGIRNLSDIENINMLHQVKEAMSLVGYTNSGKIKAPLSVGL